MTRRVSRSLYLSRRNSLEQLTTQLFFHRPVAQEGAVFDFPRIAQCKPVTNLG